MAVDEFYVVRLYQRASRCTGFDILAVLRQTPVLKNTPVIIIVSIVDQERLGLALGAADYLIKPIRKTLLLDVLCKLGHDIRDARRRRRIPAAIAQRASISRTTFVKN